MTASYLRMSSRSEWDRWIRLLAHGAAALCVGGSYERPALAAAAGVSAADLERHFGFTPLPAGPRGTIGALAGGMVHAIFRQAENPELAMELALRRVVSASSLADMSRRTDQLPSRRAALALAAESNGFLADTAQLFEHAVVRPSTAAYARVSAQLQVMLESVPSAGEVRTRPPLERRRRSLRSPALRSCRRPRP